MITVLKIGRICRKVWSRTCFLRDYFVFAFVFKTTTYIGRRVDHCSAPGIESPVKWGSFKRLM